MVPRDLRFLVRRLYLDNAATSFPKPPEVYEAMVLLQTAGVAKVGLMSKPAEGR